MNLENLATTAYGFASDYLIGTDNALMPMFLLNREKTSDIIGVPFRNAEEKKALVLKVAVEVAKKGCTAWSFLSESWFAHSYNGDPDRRAPADRPDRREGVFCLISDGKTTEIRSWEILRNAEGKCIELKTLASDGHEIESWIAEVINRAKLLHEELGL